MDEKNIFPILETERLILRQLKIEDAKDLYSYFSDEEVMKYYGMYPIENLMQAENIINNLNKSFEDSNGFRWAITIKGSDRVIGTLGFHNWSKRHFRAEIGYELSKDYWGCGYMREALNRVLIYGFYTLKLERIEGLVYPENLASQKSLEKIGFKREGMLKHYAYFREQFQDLLMYALLKDEYKNSLL